MTDPRRRRSTADTDIVVGPVEPVRTPSYFDVMDAFRAERAASVGRAEPPVIAVPPMLSRDVRDRPFVRAIRQAVTEPTDEERIQNRGAIVESDDGSKVIELEPIEIEGDPRTERSTPTTSFVRGMANTVAMGQMPRVLAAVDATHGLPYDARRAEWERYYSDSQRDNPEEHAAGVATGVLGGMLTSAGPVSQFVARGATPAARIGRAALTAGGVEAVPAALDSNADTAAGVIGDVAMRAIPAAAMGIGGAGIAEIARLSRNAPALERMAESMDETAAPYRVRSAGARTQGFQRLVDDLPGGQRRAAETLSETGIMPRGTMLGSIDAALERARSAESRAGARIENTRRAMDLLSPDDLRGVPSLDDAVRMPGQVDAEPLARAYEDIASRYRGIPGAESIRESALSLADEVRATGPMTFQQAQTHKQFLDSMINWADDRPGQRLRPLMENRQEVRRALARSMDEAVAQDIGPDAALDYQRNRRNWQAANLFRRMGEDTEFRNAANRVASPSDQAAAALGAMGENGSITRGVMAGIANRVLRGREASMVAGTLENMADAARKIASRDASKAWIMDALAAARPDDPRTIAMIVQRIAARDPVAAQQIVRAADPFGEIPSDQMQQYGAPEPQQEGHTLDPFGEISDEEMREYQ